LVGVIFQNVDEPFCEALRTAFATERHLGDVVVANLGSRDV